MKSVAKHQAKPRRINLPKILSDAEKAIAAARVPEEALGVDKQLHTLEVAMTNAGLYSPDEVRRVNEHRMRARWQLGWLLRKIKRIGGPGRGKKMSPSDTSFTAELERLELNRMVALEAERISCMPKDELEKVLARNHKNDVLNSFAGLVEAARPWWYAESRKAKHQKIAAGAAAAAQDEPDIFGPFPLIYADPPWKFDIYSEKGLERTPDQHYPTLSDLEIIDFKVAGRPMSEVIAASAALFLWCTSSNMARALTVMDAWGFEFKTSAVWDKQKTGLGLVFRNQHEVILYGTKGSMPGPQFQPSSLFSYPRGPHSRKPPEVRAAIEKMYPDFDENSRLELFARETVPGWTAYGFEANTRQAAE